MMNKNCGIYSIKNMIKIFKNEDKKEKITQFFEDFPYKIIIKKKFKNNENICILDGKNNLENLKEFEISKDEDSIIHLLDKINNNEYCINLFFKAKSFFIISNLNFSKCENYDIILLQIIFLASSTNFFPDKFFPTFDIKIILLYFFLLSIL